MSTNRIPSGRVLGTRRSLLTAMGAAAIGISFTACGQKPAAEATKSANGEEAKLNFYNWDTYIGETTLGDFKKATGVDVNMSLFATNDELFAKLKAGNPGFDVIVPSNEFVTRMGQAGLLEPLDKVRVTVADQYLGAVRRITPQATRLPEPPAARLAMSATWRSAPPWWPCSLPATDSR